MLWCGFENERFGPHVDRVNPVADHNGRGEEIPSEEIAWLLRTRRLHLTAAPRFTLGRLAAFLHHLCAPQSISPCPVRRELANIGRRPRDHEVYSNRWEHRDRCGSDHKPVESELGAGGHEHSHNRVIRFQQSPVDKLRAMLLPVQSTVRLGPIFLLLTRRSEPLEHLPGRLIAEGGSLFKAAARRRGVAKNVIERA